MEPAAACLFNHEIAVGDGILVFAVRESEIRAPDRGIRAGNSEHLVRILGTLIGEVVLAGQDPLARNRAEGFQ